MKYYATFLACTRLGERLRVARFHSGEFMAFGVLSLTALICGSGSLYVAIIHSALQEGALASCLIAMGGGLTAYLWKKSGRVDALTPAAAA